MKYKLIKRVTFFLLFVLALSCSGLSLGMIAHSATDMMPGMNMEMSSEMHACCGLGENQVDATEAGMLMIHDTVDIIGVQEQIVLTIAILFFVLLVEVVVNKIAIIQRLYMKQWRERSEYFALLYKRLFSSGLLHSKVL